MSGRFPRDTYRGWSDRRLIRQATETANGNGRKMAAELAYRLEEEIDRAREFERLLKRENRRACNAEARLARAKARR